MRNRKGDDCPWQPNFPAEQDLGSLQAALKCASGQGCGDCVSCSERALELFLRTARRNGGRQGN